MTANVLTSVSADGEINHWHVTSGRKLHTIPKVDDNALYCIDYNYNGTQFSVGGKDYKVRVYDESTKTLLQTLEGSIDIPGHSNRIFSLKYFPDDPNLHVSCGWDNTMIIYDVRYQYPVASMLGPHVCGESIDVNGNYLIAGSYSIENNLTVWDL